MRRKRAIRPALILGLACGLIVLHAPGCVFETRYEPPKILFIGNSITHAAENEAFRWPNNHGMAASAESLDYVHRTVRILKERGLELEPVLGSRDCRICDGVIGEHLEHAAEVRDIKPRYVVVQLGENADPVEILSGRLTNQYLDLLTALKQGGASDIFCISNWGEDTLGTPRNEAILRAIRHFDDVKVVDISALSKDSDNYGDSTLFPDKAVQWHPGDKGMEGIARALAASILGEDP